MITTRHVFSWIGLLGTLVCGAGILGVWYAERRVDQIRQRGFESIAASLAHVEDRVELAQDLVYESRLNVEEVQHRLKEWTWEETADRLNARLNLEVRAEQVGNRLQQAENLLGLAHTMADNIVVLLKVGDEAGFGIKADTVLALSDRISALESDVAAAKETAAGLRLRDSDGDGAGEAAGQRVEQIVKLATSLIATFSQLDERVRGFATRLAETREAVERIDAQVHNRILGVAAIATLFLLWMGSGQIALWRLLA